MRQCCDERAAEGETHDDGPVGPYAQDRGDRGQADEGDGHPVGGQLRELRTPARAHVGDADVQGEQER